jgi:hypothetical protein
MRVANLERLLTNKNLKHTPITLPTITSSKPSSSTLPKSKEKFHVDSKDSIIKATVNPSISSKPSQLPSLEESVGQLVVIDVNEYWIDFK